MHVTTVIVHSIYQLDNYQKKQTVTEINFSEDNAPTFPENLLGWSVTKIYQGIYRMLLTSET